MALSVNSNASAVMAMTTVSSANSDLSVSMERLSSGSRLNSASDDAAGIAIVSRLTADIRGNNQAVRNSLDGQALIAVAEGAHKEIEIYYSECGKFRFNQRMTPIISRIEIICMRSSAPWGKK